MEDPKEMLEKSRAQMLELLETPDDRWVGFTDPEGNIIRLANTMGHLIAPLSTDIEDKVKDCYRNFEAKDGDIWIVSYPRSGTHWLWQLTNMLVSGKLELVPEFHKEQYQPEYWPPQYYKPMPGPRRLFNTHLSASLLPQSVEKKKSKVIVIMRNPRDVAVSNYKLTLAHHVFFRYKGTWDGYFRLFMDGQVERGSWFDFVTEWWAKGKDNENITFVTFEDLKKDAAGVLKNLGSFLGVERDDETIDKIVEACSFEKMKKQGNMNASDVVAGKKTEDPEMGLFRKGKVGGWRDYFSDEQDKELQKKYDATIPKTGITFNV